MKLCLVQTLVLVLQVSFLLPKHTSAQQASTPLCPCYSRCTDGWCWVGPWDCGVSACTCKYTSWGFAWDDCVIGTTTTTTEAPSATPEPQTLVQGLVYVGCYNDAVGYRNKDLPYYAGAAIGSTMGGSLAHCNSMCKNADRGWEGLTGFKYFALQNLGECWCGDTYGVYGESNGASAWGIPDMTYVCDSPECPNGVYCGGDWQNAIYETGVVTTPDSWYTVRGLEYIGCLIDQYAPWRDLRTFGGLVTNSTDRIKDCNAICSTIQTSTGIGKTYFGLQVDDANPKEAQCWCGNRIGMHGADGRRSACYVENQDAGCSLDVPCGGVWRNAVYRVGNVTERVVMSGNPQGTFLGSKTTQAPTTAPPSTSSPTPTPKPLTTTAMVTHADWFTSAADTTAAETSSSPRPINDVTTAGQTSTTTTAPVTGADNDGGVVTTPVPTLKTTTTAPVTIADFTTTTTNATVSDATTAAVTSAADSSPIIPITTTAAVTTTTTTSNLTEANTAIDTARNVTVTSNTTATTTAAPTTAAATTASDDTMRTPQLPRSPTAAATTAAATTASVSTALPTTIAPFTVAGSSEVTLDNALLLRSVSSSYSEYMSQPESVRESTEQQLLITMAASLSVDVSRLEILGVYSGSVVFLIGFRGTQQEFAQAQQTYATALADPQSTLNANLAANGVVPDPTYPAVAKVHEHGFFPVAASAPVTTTTTKRPVANSSSGGTTRPVSSSGSVATTKAGQVTAGVGKPAGTSPTTGGSGTYQASQQPLSDLQQPSAVVDNSMSSANNHLDFSNDKPSATGSITSTLIIIIVGCFVALVVVSLLLARFCFKARASNLPAEQDPFLQPGVMLNDHRLQQLRQQQTSATATGPGLAGTTGTDEKKILMELSEVPSPLKHEDIFDDCALKTVVLSSQPPAVDKTATQPPVDGKKPKASKKERRDTLVDAADGLQGLGGGEKKVPEGKAADKGDWPTGPGLDAQSQCCDTEAGDISEWS